MKVEILSRLICLNASTVDAVNVLSHMQTRTLHAIRSFAYTRESLGQPYRLKILKHSGKCGQRKDRCVILTGPYGITLLLLQAFERALRSANAISQKSSAGDAK